MPDTTELDRPRARHSGGQGGFSLAHLVRLVCGQAAEADPHRLAALVLDLISPADYHAALAQALPQVVRYYAVSSREPVVVPPPKKPRVGVPWHRRWARQLNTLVATGDATGGREWKRLRDCTSTDLTKAASLRRRQAARMNANADALDELAALLDRYGAKTVGDLPDDVAIPPGVAE